MDEVVREARDKGFSETLFKRRRELPNIQFAQLQYSWFCRRTAINSLFGGSAADILKLPMIQLDKPWLQWLSTKMLLQVHDKSSLKFRNRVQR